MAEKAGVEILGNDVILRSPSGNIILECQADKTVKFLINGVQEHSVSSAGPSTSVGPLTVVGNIVMSDAAAELVGGATSFAIRNAADNANNVLVSDAGAVTIRAGLTITASGLTVTAGDATLTAGNLVMSTAASKIVPGATSLSLRNNANNADNLILTDAGAATIRAGLTVTAGGLTVSAGVANFTAAGLKTVQAVTNVHDTTPTAAELTTALGNPATLGRGFIGTVDDNDGDAIGYIVWCSDASFYFVKGTKAT